jgi:hypothetical protein
MAFRYSPKIATDGLVFLMDFKNKKSYPGTGTTTTDIALQKSGIVANGATYDGDLGFEFDGLDDQIQLGRIPNTDPFSLYGTTGFTIDIWFNATSGGDSFQRLIDKSSAGSAAYGFAVTRPNSNLVRGLELYVGGTQILTTGASNYYNFGEWVNGTITCDIVNPSNDWRGLAYFNGIQQVSDNYTSAPPSWPQITTDAAIGTWNHSTGREFKGTIGRIAIYNRVLDSVEIAASFNELKNRFII